MIRYTSCLVLGVGFSGSADQMVLFLVTSNPSWRQAAILDNLNGHISATAHSVHLYSAHRAVIFVIAQLFCHLDDELLAGLGNQKHLKQSSTTSFEPYATYAQFV